MKRISSIRPVLVAALLFFASGSASAVGKNEAPTPAAAPVGMTEAATPTAPSARGVQVDINTATREELMRIPGIGEGYAQKIIGGRPYKMKSQLKSRGLIPDQLYNRITDRIIARQPKK